MPVVAPPPSAPTSPPAEPDCILEVENLRIVFGADEDEVCAVDGASFKLRRGQVLALVGESGCGKSAASSAILRLVPKPGRIAGGKITVHPRGRPAIDVTALDPHSPALHALRGGLVGMIFQEPMTSLSPVHSVGSQIGEAIRLHGTISREQAREAAIAMLRRVGIPAPERRFEQYPHELSGGMRQRVVIAMALVCRPELVIADEPTTALDVTIQAQVLASLKRLQVEIGCSILLITHNLGIVAQSADEIAVMYLGRVVEEGGVAEVLAAPRHPYTLGLLRSMPGAETRGRRLHSIAGSVPPLDRIPAGCAFHPRCTWAQPGRCDRGPAPELRRVATARVACHFAEAIAAGEMSEKTVVVP